MERDASKPDGSPSRRDRRRRGTTCRRGRMLESSCQCDQILVHCIKMTACWVLPYETLSGVLKQTPV